VPENYRKHFLEYEFVGAVLITAILIALAEYVWGREHVFELLKGTRLALYAAVASIAGSLLGFIITSLSVIVAFGDSPRLRIIRESGHFPTLLNVFLNTTYILAFTTLWALVALFLDRESAAKIWVTYLALFTAVLSTLRVYRSIWALGKVVTIAV
jgi:hypothetical protein